MGTDVHVRVVGGRPGLTAEAQRAVEDREARWSRFLPDSELSRLNGAGGGRPVIVSPDTFSLIAAAVEACRLTGGAFDPTVLTTLVAAGYDRPLGQLTPPDAAPARSPAPPGDGGIPAAPGVAGIDLHPASCAVVLPAGVRLDLGGIAKGATADAVSAELLAAGAEGCCVNVGGDLRVRGAAPDGAGWVVGLDCPGAAEPAGLRVRLADGAVCTSTVLSRRWAGPRAGATEHHLRHPATGAALNTGLWSVTVVAASAVQAEVLTKAAFVAGADGAAAVIGGHGATGVLVADGGDLVPLAGLDPFLVR
ncbi:MAG: FAD:protein FMN transferase [Acidimicrobiales bacterium]